MKYFRCTRCELNYRTEEETYCKVCEKELRGESEPDENEPDGDLCPFCEEAVLEYGEDMCPACAAVHKAKESAEAGLPVGQKITLIEVDK